MSTSLPSSSHQTTSDLNDMDASAPSSEPTPDALDEGDDIDGEDTVTQIDDEDAIDDAAPSLADERDGLL